MYIVWNCFFFFIGDSLVYFSKVYFSIVYVGMVKIEDYKVKWWWNGCMNVNLNIENRKIFNMDLK